MNTQTKKRRLRKYEIPLKSTILFGQVGVSRLIQHEAKPSDILVLRHASLVLYHMVRVVVNKGYKYIAESSTFLDETF